MANKKVVIMGGGTFSHVRNHLALATPAFGQTARDIYHIINSDNRFNKFDIQRILTKMACSESDIVTNDDVKEKINHIINDTSVKIVFMNMALCDYTGEVAVNGGEDPVASSKYAERLLTSFGDQFMRIRPAEKLIGMFRKERKDIFVVGFKTTCDADQATMFERGLNLLKTSSLNAVLVNDTATRSNMIVTPEEGAYHYHKDRAQALKRLVDIAWHRSHLSFTRSTVIAGNPVSWDSAVIPRSLRHVVEWCINKNAYKVFNGVTTGHFATKLSDTEFLTSIRKTNFNDITSNGMVNVTTDGPDNVIAMGAKPSVGGQSQRIIFKGFSETDCIVHFHCPLKEKHPDDITVMSQFEYECGSHECGENTANGLTEVRPGIFAVMLDNHGPNIVFNKNIRPEQVINFIENNFDLDRSTSGYEQVYLPKEGKY